MLILEPSVQKFYTISNSDVQKINIPWTRISDREPSESKREIHVYNLL